MDTSSVPRVTSIESHTDRADGIVDRSRLPVMLVYPIKEDRTLNKLKTLSKVLWMDHAFKIVFEHGNFELVHCFNFLTEL